MESAPVQPPDRSSVQAAENLPLATYAYTLYHTAERKGISLDERLHRVTLESAVPTGTEELVINGDPADDRVCSVRIVFEEGPPDRRQPLCEFIATLLHIAETCGDTADTDRIEMTAEGKRGRIHTSLHIEDDARNQACQAWAKPASDNIKH